MPNVKSLSDPELFSAVFNEFWTPLWKYSTVITGDPELSKEVISDYFAYVWERRFDIVIHGSLASYLFGAVRNRSINALRDSYREANRMHALRDHLENDADIEEANEPSHDASPNSETTDLRTMLGQLSPRYREVIQLRWLQRLSAEDIAAVMGISVDAANKLMQRAFKKLRASAAQSQNRL